MSVKNIINPTTGKIDPIYIPTLPPTATPTLNEVLTAGNSTGGILIDAHGGNVVCDGLKCISIEAATAPLFNDIAVDANLITAQFGKTGFSADALITCNEQNSTKKVIETTNASTNAIYKVAEGNINYETQTKILTVNPLSFPPSPLLSTQGLVVNGSVKAPFLGSTLTPYSQVIGYDSVSGQLIAQSAGVQNPMISNLNAGNYMITNANDIQTNSIFISKGGVQPRVEFQDGTGFAQGQVGWNSITGRTLLSGVDGFKINKAGDKYKIEASDAIGYLGIETSGVDTEIRHYDATASIMETRVRVNAGGNMSIGGAYDGSLFLEKAGGGTYAGVNINNTDDLTLFSGGGDIITTQALRPDGGIKDITNSTGLAGEYLSKNGSNQLSWSSSAPATWAGTAMSDLNMNGFKITDNIGNLNLQANGTSNVVLANSAGDTKIEVGEDALGNKRIEMTANNGTNRLVLFGSETWISGDQSAGSPAKLRFYDTGSLGNVDVVYDTNQSLLQASGARKFQLFTGANGIMSILCNEMTAESGVEVEGGVDLILRTNGAEIVGTIDTTGTPKSFRFGSANNNLYLTNNTVQDVNVNDFAQFTTTQCAVPRQIRDVIPSGNITTTNPPASPLYTGSTFSWLYSGSRNSSSAFCSATRVEVDVDVILVGSLANDFQFALSLYNQTTTQDILPDNYDGVNATTPFTGLEPSVPHTKTLFTDDTVFIKFSSIFDCSNFTDGDQVEIRLWAITKSGVQTVNNGRINIKLRPTAIW